MTIKLKRSSVLLIDILFFVIIISAILRIVGFADSNKFLTGAVWGCILLFVLITLANNTDKTCFKRTFETLIIGEILLLLNYKFNIFASNTADAFAFMRVAESYYNGDFGEDLTNFPNVINAAYHVFGLNNFVIFQIGLFFTAASVLYAIKTINELGIGGNIREAISLLMAVSPFKFIYGGQMLREPVYLFFITVSFFYYVRWKKYNNAGSFLWAIVLTAPAVYLHTGFAMVPIAYLLVELFSSDMKPIMKIAFIFFSILIAGVISLFSGINYLSVASSSSSLISYYDAQYVFYAEAGSLYLTWMHPANTAQLLLFTPIRMIYFWLSPLPDQWNSISKIASFLFDSMVYLCTLIATIRLFRTKRYLTSLQRSTFNLLCVIFFIYVAVFSWGTIASGTAIRHRNSLINLCFILQSLDILSQTMKNSGHVVLIGRFGKNLYDCY